VVRARRRSPQRGALAGTMSRTAAQCRGRIEGARALPAGDASAVLPIPRSTRARL